jgi:hypothetical protein
MRRAIRLTHTLWGGRFNPIIPIGDTEEDKQLSENLVETFHVDVLYPLADDLRIKDFLQQFKYLLWPEFQTELFQETGRGKIAEFLDIYHPVRDLFEEHIKDKASPSLSLTLYEWESIDPLGDVFLAFFGAYPPTAEVGKDYGDFVEKNLRGTRVKLSPDGSVPADAYKAFTPAFLSRVDLEEDFVSRRDNPGFFIGSSTDFTDVVSFWNLRAANINLVFYDKTQSNRLDALKDSYMEVLSKQPPDPSGWRDRIPIWATTDQAFEQLDFGPKVIHCITSDATWNGLNVRPPAIYIDEHSVLASLDEEGAQISLSFQLPPKPFFEDYRLHNQKLVTSVRPIADITRTQQSTIKPPYIPELNEYYGREVHFIWNKVRAERESLGVFTDVTDHNLTLRALPIRNLVAKIFEVFGMKAEPSAAGLIAQRLISQMGGIQGCRVFKIGGVRKLIEAYGPLKSFTRSSAIQQIGDNDPATGLPRFEKHEGLFIERRDKPRLKPEDAFTYLLKKGVFQAGLKLQCLHCGLEFWIHLDDIATDVKCELCGHFFNVTSQLRDRDWAYRRSGLFGREDHQEGGIPVALTLQQLDTLLTGELLYCTAMHLSSVGADISPCETDFVAISQKGYWRDEKVSLAIGECKSRGEITADDVLKLTRVADAFPRKRIESYIIFSKTSQFTPEEIERCKAAQDRYRPRVILLSERELEPYFVYERTGKEFNIRSTAISFEDLAQATHHIYFDPKRK